MWQGVRRGYKILADGALPMSRYFLYFFIFSKSTTYKMLTSLVFTLLPQYNGILTFTNGILPVCGFLITDVGDDGAIERWEIIHLHKPALIMK